MDKGKNMMHDLYHSGSGYAGLWGWGWLIMLIFWGFIIWAVVALIRGTARKHDHPADSAPTASRKDMPHPDRRSHEGAMSILNERYARGDISKAEYEMKKADIMKDSADGSIYR